MAQTPGGGSGMSTGYSRSISRREIGLALVRSRNSRIQQLYSDAFGRPTRMIAQSYAGRIAGAALKVGVIAITESYQLARGGGRMLEDAVGEAGKWREGRTSRTTYAMSLVRGSRKRRSTFELPY